MNWSSPSDVDPVGQPRPEHVDAAVELVDDRDGVGVGLLRDGDRDAGLAVEVG